jgi:hypothetical protein
MPRKSKKLAPDTDKPNNLPDKPKHAGGRPTIYTRELAERICEAVATHPCGLNPLCAMFDWMPDHQTIKTWRRKHSEFLAMYLEAKQLQGLEIMEEMDKNAQDLPAVNEEINRFNAIFRFKQFQLAKLSPRFFGDKPIEDNTQNKQQEISQLADMVNKLVKKYEREY